MPSILLNGEDLRSLGVVVSGRPRCRDTASRDLGMVPLLGAMGGVPGGVRFPQGAPMTLVGHLLRDTYALRVALEDRFKDLAMAGLVTLTHNDGVTTRQIEGYSSPGVQFTPAGVDGRSRGTGFTATFICPDPTWADLEPTLVAMPTANTRYPVALGTAPSRFKFRAMGASPALTYRTAAGDTVWALTQTQAVTGTEDWFDFDATTGRIWFYNNGVKTDAITTLTGGNQDWGRAALDPQDGDYATSQWPTVSCNVAAELLYWKRWL